MSAVLLPTEDGTYYRNPETGNWVRVEKTDGYFVALTQGYEDPESILTGCLGIWTDPNTGERDLDRVEWVALKSYALTLGRKYKQKAIWDIANGTEIWL